MNDIYFCRVPRDWRTRPDLLAEVWESDVVPLLEADEEGILQATAVLEELQERCPEKVSGRQLLTLQQRMRDWRASHGPAKAPARPLRGSNLTTLALRRSE